MPRKAANTASANDMVSSYETCCHSLFFLSHPLYFSQYLSSVEMESIQHLQCWFYFDMLVTINISFQKCSSSFLVLIYYFDFSPVVSLSGYNVCVCVCVCVCTRVHMHVCMQACSVVSDSLWHHRLLPARLLCPWTSPGKNTGVGCHFLLQGVFLTLGSNPDLLPLLHWQVGSLPLSHLGSLLKDNHHVNISWHLNTAAQSMGPKCPHRTWDQSLNGYTHKRNSDWAPCKSLPNISWEFGNWIYTAFS